MATNPNKNRRIYNLTEMVNEVERYKKEFIASNRSLGELSHPESSTEVNLERACHMVINLEQKDNIFYGKSKILSTPMGTLTKQLINDGVKLGISSRALGKLIPLGENNQVEGFHLICLDVVHEPSAPALLDSIMEGRQFLIQEGGRIVELACNSLECRLNSIPKKDVETYLKESFLEFINNLRK